MRITPQHQALYQEYFDAREFRPRPSRWQQTIEELAQKYQATSIIDYGCARDACLSKFSNLPIVNYDPCVREYSAVPEPADLVVCLHVLEHVEAECIDNVLDHLQSLARKALFIAVSTERSTKVLPDGTAWHSFVRDARWWRQKLAGFAEQPAMDNRKEFVALKC